MFNFLGVFANDRELVPHLKEQWPRADVVTLHYPFDGAAVRIPETDYDPAEEGLPEGFSGEVIKCAGTWPEARFLALRTWCWDGLCFNDGCVLEGGEILLAATDDPYPAPPHALRQLVKKMGADIGPSGMFDPLRRDFDWQRNDDISS
jgi:hypothetical protein